MQSILRMNPVISVPFAAMAPQTSNRTLQTTAVNSKRLLRRLSSLLAHLLEHLSVCRTPKDLVPREHRTHSRPAQTVPLPYTPLYHSLSLKYHANVRIAAYTATSSGNTSSTRNSSSTGTGLITSTHATSSGSYSASTAGTGSPVSSTAGANIDHRQAALGPMAAAAVALIGAVAAL